jgi:hypothetical protein
MGFISPLASQQIHLNQFTEGHHVNLNARDKNGPKNMSFHYGAVGAVLGFIVCGVGSSGSVVAAPLAEDDNVSVHLAPYARLVLLWSEMLEVAILAGRAGRR